MFDLLGGLLGGLGNGLGGLFGGTGGLLSGGFQTPANVPLPPSRPAEFGASFISDASAGAMPTSLFGGFGKNMSDDQKKMLQMGNAMMQPKAQQERQRLGQWGGAPIGANPIPLFQTIRRG